MSPLVVRLKILLSQKLWLSKIGWDDPIPEDVCADWRAIIVELQSSAQLRFPRPVHSGTRSLQLHVFSDASQLAYGTVAYVRCEMFEEVQVRLFCSKTRVAPTNQQSLTIPRLELMGALLSVKLASNIVRATSETSIRVFYWTDAKVVLAWLKNNRQCWKPFVQNRVNEILQRSAPDDWHHCPGAQNPPTSDVSTTLTLNNGSRILPLSADEFRRAELRCLQAL